MSVAVAAHFMAAVMLISAIAVFLIYLGSDWVSGVFFGAILLLFSIFLEIFAIYAQGRIL